MASIDKRTGIFTKRKNFMAADIFYGKILRIVYHELFADNEVAIDPFTNNCKLLQFI